MEINQMTPGETLLDVLETACGRFMARWVEPLALRWGLHGGPIRVAEEVADQCGVSVARLAKIETRITARHQDTPWHLPTVHAALAALTAAAPCEIVTANEVLAAHSSKTGPALTAEAFLTHATRLGLTVPVRAGVGTLQRQPENRG